MNGCILFLTCTLMATMAWSIPFYPVPRAPLRVTRYAPIPSQYRIPVRQIQPEEQPERQHWERPKRQRDDYHHHGDDHRESSGVTGPVHTFVKTDKNANYKWGVRHHVGNKYAS